MSHKFTFGPVPSRRLGFSLGIDLLPMKTCTYDCVYCQLHQSSCLSIDRESFYNPKNILKEIIQKVESVSNIDYLTFSGSGEPTLSKDLGWLIDKVKKNTDKKVAVITNGSLFWMSDVRNDLKNADLVVPSLDCVTEMPWKQINRASSLISIEMILDGMKKFCDSFQNEIWLEIMIVQGINDQFDEVEAIAKFVNKLNISRVQLNTVVRPPFEKFAKPVDLQTLESYMTLFKHPTEVIVEFKKKATLSEINDVAQSILELISRRPCKEQEMANSLAIDVNIIKQNLKQLINESKLELNKDGFYCLKGSEV